jgi:peptidoglycan-associated lipoprotein
MPKRLAFAAMTTAAMLAAVGCGPTYPKCDDDEDCHEGEFCVNGMCQLCRTNDDCEPGQSCVGGRCESIPGYCASANDCPPGQECRNNQCVAPAQTSQDLGNSGGGEGACELRPVYFGFDADALDASARSTLQSNLNCMRERGITGVHVTGHCDPRGTEEYNLALGDRRARSVMEYIVNLGASPEGVSASSMGEEMASGTDEAGWSRDRRVEFTAR